MSLKRAYLGAVALYDELYAIGGYDGEYWLKEVERYNPNTRVWTRGEISIDVDYIYTEHNHKRQKYEQY